jgi:hypothetical protein
MSRSNKELREKGLKIRPKTYDPMENFPDLDEVRREAKKRVRNKAQEK